MKSSKHVETCFVRANNDFDDKLTVFRMKNNFWTKIPKNGHCEKLEKRLSENGNKLTSYRVFMLDETLHQFSFKTGFKQVIFNNGK